MHFILLVFLVYFAFYFPWSNFDTSKRDQEEKLRMEKVREDSEIWYQNWIKNDRQSGVAVDRSKPPGTGT